MTGLVGKLSGGAVFLVLFALLALLAWRTLPSAVVALEQPQAAKDYAQAWQRGELDRVSYDPASAPDVGDADPKRIAESVLTMVRDISDADQNHPLEVAPVGEPRQQVGDAGELRNGDLIQPLEVTWDLGGQRRWTYRTDVVVRETEGRQRVVWRPSAVHPDLTQGLVLVSSRLRTPRAPVLDASRRVLSASQAPTLVGSTQEATQKLAETYPGRVRPGDVVGISGLQQVYDAQLAGTAGLEIDVVRLADYAPLQPPVGQVHVVPPVPGKPLLLSLDPTWQARAEAAVRTSSTATALVAFNALTGEVLADANSGTGGRDIGLQGKYPPGSVFRIVTMLALARHTGLDSTAAFDCTAWAFGEQSFVSPATAPTATTVDVASAFARNCVSGFARAASTLSDEQLRDAGSSLGIGMPSATGTGAFNGALPPTDDKLVRVQNALGEGQVLASPLALARASATVSGGVARTSRLVLPLTAGPTDGAEPDEPTLTRAEQATLQQLMALSVRTDEQLTPLRSASAGQVFAVAGTAGYGPSAAADVHAWCTGYQGNIAFAVFVAGNPVTAATDTYRARSAAQVAADFLG